MPIAELFLSEVVETLWNQLDSGVHAEYARIHGISEKLNNWKQKLQMIRDVMDSAGERQLDDDDPTVNLWLKELREVAYDMEDLLDEFSVEVKRNASKAHAQKSNLPSCLISCCLRIDPRTLLLDHRMANKIEEVDERLEQIIRVIFLLRLMKNSKSGFPANSSQPRYVTTSLPEPKFVGREKEMEKLLARLIGIEAMDDSVQPFTVVSIVGMGGLGKTSLAQELYNHESVSKVFEVRAWTCVSDVFDMIAITRSILDAIAPSELSEGKDLNWLQNSLKECLSRRKFLIVLDDVRNENYAELNMLLKPFYSGSRGSRILLTTRNRRVADLVGDYDPALLDLMSPNECFSLLAYHATGQKSFESHPHLRDTAVQLAEKCEGMPLAAKTIGGLLRFELSDEKWKQVLDHDICKREGEYDGNSCCLRIDPPTLLSYHRSANEIEEDDRGLEEVIQQKSQLRLVDNFMSVSPTNFSQPRFITTSMPEPKFVGREKQMVKLLARLTGIEAMDDSVRPFTVVSIVGMGGLGKTALAQELYNHESVKKAFEVRAWTCVSDVFDMIAITRSILEVIAPSRLSEGKDLNWLQNSLKECLSWKKFLIVLDDIWNENDAELDMLVKPLFSGSRGSRILLTTRNRMVAELVGDRKPALLDLMSPNECLSLLAYHAIGQMSFENHPHLHDTAVQLAEKCEGMPLAKKTIGGLLHFENSDEKWKEVLDHDIWNREDEYESIPPALKLSYLHLPIHLKRCFVACALFPKDYPFDEDELIHLWIVQGLVPKGNAKAYRDVGVEYLRQLEARSLLHKAANEKTRYSMHLMNNLAKSVAGVTCFSSNKHRYPSGEISLGEVRHAAFLTRYYERCPLKRMDEYYSMKKLRTFMPFQISAHSFSNVSISNKLLHDLVMGMKCLRVLSLRCFHIRHVPDEIGELKLLRSIDFSYTLVEALPNSICDLVDLQYLLLQGCKKLKKLPRNIHKLTKLLHLDITEASRLREMPPHIGDLTSLEILSSFVVGKEVGQELKELGPLKGLQRELHIRNLQAVDVIEDARIANLEEKEGISVLSFDFRSNVGISRNEEDQLMLLDLLQPPKKIKCFSISGYGGKKFPFWFGDLCMNNVVSITMEDCVSVESLPPFGRLPSLEKLNISGLEGVSIIGAEFYGTRTPFQSLSSLSFHSMLSWKEWPSYGDCENDQPFPCLRELTMVNCPKLKKGLPGKLGSLFKLDIRNCPLLETTRNSLSLPSLNEMYFESCDAGLLTCLVDIISMTKMVIHDVPKLVHFDGSNWVSLEEIQIQNCPRFKFFIHGNGANQRPPKLKNLVIRDCKKLKKLPDDLCCLKSLEEMTVASCRKFFSLPIAGLPPTLSKLELADCPSLPTSQFLGMKLPESLEELTLNNLEGLETVKDTIIESHLSRCLRKLNIDDCRSLKTLPACLQHLSSLSEISVSRCKALDLDCFPALPRNLSRFQLVGCPKVKSLPNDMHSLTSLKEVDIRSCPRITSLPEGGLPPKLEWLRIASCENLNQSLEKWELPKLTALQQLHIVGGMECMDKMVCFPSVDDGGAWRLLLPSSLVILDICFMEKLERLASGLCTHLTSLQELRIGYCRKMKHLPDDGLPDSLEVIEISGCDLLEKRCSEPDGDYWPRLQRIPEVIIY